MGVIILFEQFLFCLLDDVVCVVFLDYVWWDGFVVIGLDQFVKVMFVCLYVLNVVFGDFWLIWIEIEFQDSVNDWFEFVFGYKLFILFKFVIIVDVFKVQFDWLFLCDFDEKVLCKIRFLFGCEVLIDWFSDCVFLIECKVQEFYGVNCYLNIVEECLLIIVQILFFGGKFVVIMCDLLGFWIGGYFDMVKDMCG